MKINPDATKRVYLVRHGSTPGNEIKAFQTRETPLSETGLAQAERVAERFTHLPIEVILASTMTRAQQTAEAIHRKTGAPLISSDLLIEHLKPSVIQGRLHTDPETKALWDTVALLFASNERHSDEENFEDLKARGLKALELIRSREEYHVAAVMHGTFLKMVIFLMMFGETLTAEQFIRGANSLHMANTGITVVDVIPLSVRALEFQTDGLTDWHVRVINDSAHLG